jgi:hypothetical protein
MLIAKLMDDFSIRNRRFGNFFRDRLLLMVLISLKQLDFFNQRVELGIVNPCSSPLLNMLKHIHSPSQVILRLALGLFGCLGFEALELLFLLFKLFLQLALFFFEADKLNSEVRFRMPTKEHVCTHKLGGAAIKGWTFSAIIADRASPQRFGRPRVQAEFPSR